jgi:hypothetical protein
MNLEERSTTIFFVPAESFYKPFTERSVDWQMTIIPALFNRDTEGKIDRADLFVWYIHNIIDTRGWRRKGQEKKMVSREGIEPSLDFYRKCWCIE